MGKKKHAAAAAAVDLTATTSPIDLKALIRDHSLFFDQLVELIPARFFLPFSSDDKPWFPGLPKSKKMKLKAQTRENIIKSRRDRLDPTVPASTLDRLRQSLEEDDEDDENEEEEEIEEEEEEEEEEKVQSKPVLTEERPVTYEELQRRLRQRIAELSAGRNTRPEAKLKHEKRNEMKNKKKLKVQTKKNQEKNKEKGGDVEGNTGKRKREDGKDETFSKKHKVIEPTDITFGQVRIDGKENKKRKKKLSKEQELERAKKLDEMKKDPVKGKKVSWKAAVSKAAGEKVHDDPKLLKQSIKKEKKRQVKSKQKWKERNETVAKSKAEKQSKRAGNIKERIHQNKMRKIEKREKKLMRPGFEGTKEGYMNG